MKQVAAFIDEGVRISLEAKADLAAKAALEAGGEKPPTTMTNLKVPPEMCSCSQAESSACTGKS